MEQSQFLLWNYSTIVPALISAGYLEIVNGTTKRPLAGTLDADKWDTEAGKAIGLINASVIPAIYKKFKIYLDPMDPVKIWEYLKTYDQTDNPVYIETTRTQFDSFAFQEDNINIMEGYLKLSGLQTRLEGTPKAINNDSLRARPIAALPENDYWRPIKVNMIKDTLSINKILAKLMSY